MAKDFAKAFYRSAAWLSVRVKIIDDQHGLCQVCREVGSIVHHKVELTPYNIGDPAIALSPDNLMLVCHSCHETCREGRAITDDDLRFDEDGNLVRIGHPPIDEAG